MGAVQTVLQFATSLDAQNVQECYDDEPQRKGEPYCVYFRIVDESPFLHPGAGRLGEPTILILEVRLYTRLVLDIAGGDPIWSRDVGRGALVMRETIRNAIDGKNLFAAYDPTTGLGSGAVLTIEPVQQVPASEQSVVFAKKNPKDKTFGEHDLYFQIRAIKPLTV